MPKRQQQRAGPRRMEIRKGRAARYRQERCMTVKLSMRAFTESNTLRLVGESDKREEVQNTRGRAARVDNGEVNTT